METSVKRSRLLGRFLAGGTVAALLSFAAPALLLLTSTAEARSAATAYAMAKNDPVKLRNFLFKMPKGGDLHNHLTGTIYAESYLGWAAEDGKCWNKITKE